MKKIVYISADYFFDVDFPILKGIKQNNNLLWLAIITKGERYNIEEVTNYCTQYSIKNKIYKPKGRRRSPHYFIVACQIIKSILSFDPDCIYFEYMGDYYLYYLAKVFLPQKKIIIALHDVIPHSNFMNKSYKIFHKKKCGSFDNYQTFSLSQQSLLKKVYKKNSICIPLAMKDYGISAVKPCSKKECTKLLFFGSIMSYKGLSKLIDACEQLKKEGITNYKLTIAGKGNDWEICNSHIESPELYNLNIGFINNRDVANLFRSHHYLILPYLDVTQSGPLMIAYNYNLPIIASDLDEFKEYITNDKDGFLFSYKKEEFIPTLKKAILQNDTTYSIFIENLRQKIEKNYSLNLIINRYNLMYQEIIDKYSKI